MNAADTPPVAVVTGSSSGIGLATTAHLLQRGWRVVGLDLNPPSGEGSESPPPNLVRIRCDVGSPESVEAAFREIAGLHPRVDALICSAGILRIGALDAMAVADFDLLFAVNTRGPWLCARAALPLLRAARAAGGTARIVFAGSISGLRPKVGSGAYAASKAALHTLTGVLAVELAPSGILVNAVAPGTVDTPMMEAVGADGGRAGGGFRPSGASPLGRVAQPADVVGVIDFLLGPASGYVTGVVLPVDGGTRAAYSAAGSPPADDPRP
jgi:NAD(P)-dependent dehydrogenase (short-subunit alcohol dehydrogenase family)